MGHGEKRLVTPRCSLSGCNVWLHVPFPARCKRVLAQTALHQCWVAAEFDRGRPANDHAPLHEKRRLGVQGLGWRKPQPDPVSQADPRRKHDPCYATRLVETLRTLPG